MMNTSIWNFLERLASNTFLSNGKWGYASNREGHMFLPLSTGSWTMDVMDSHAPFPVSSVGRSAPVTSVMLTWEIVAFCLGGDEDSGLFRGDPQKSLRAFQVAHWMPSEEQMLASDENLGLRTLTRGNIMYRLRNCNKKCTM